MGINLNFDEINKWASDRNPSKKGYLVIQQEADGTKSITVEKSFLWLGGLGKLINKHFCKKDYDLSLIFSNIEKNELKGNLNEKARTILSNKVSRHLRTEDSNSARRITMKIQTIFDVKKGVSDNYFIVSNENIDQVIDLLTSRLMLAEEIISILEKLDLSSISNDNRKVVIDALQKTIEHQKSWINFSKCDKTFCEDILSEENFTNKSKFERNLQYINLVGLNLQPKVKGTYYNNMEEYKKARLNEIKEKLDLSIKVIEEGESNIEKLEGFINKLKKKESN